MGRFTSAGSWRGLLSGWPVLLSLALGLVLTGMAARQVRDAEQKVVQSRFDQEARSRIVLVREIFDAQLRELQGLRRFIFLKPDLTRDDFQALTRLSDRLKMTLAWNAHVPASEFEEYLARMRQLQGPDFEVTDPRSGAPVNADSALRHYPISFFKTNEAGVDLRGLDTGVLASRVRAYERALASAEPTMITSIKTLDDPDNQSGLLVFAPVYRTAQSPAVSDRHFGNLRGFVGLGLRLSNLTELVATMDSSRPALALQFTDITRGDLPLQLHGTEAVEQLPGLSYSEELVLADRVLEVTAFPADPGAWAPRPTGLLVWVVGVLGSVLVAGYIALVLLQRSRANRLVEARTGELQEANAYLSSLLDSASDVAIIATDQHGVVTLFNPGAEKLLGYSAAEVVSQQSLESLYLTEEIQQLRQRFLREHGHIPAGFAALAGLIAAGHPRSERWHFVRADGTSRPIQSTLSAIADQTGETIGYLVIALDMMQYEKTVAALRASDELLQNLSSEVPGVIYQYVQLPDGEHYFSYVSDGIEEIFEISRETARHNGQAAFKRAMPGDQDQVLASINRSRDELTRWSEEFRVRLPIRGERWLRGDATPSRLESGATVWHGHISDITDMKNLEFQLREQATVDPLTGTFNRRHLESHWLREMARYRRTGAAFAMIMLDIDHFKKINDTHGHDVGDEVLVGIGRLLRNEVRSTDVVYRLGGEEFLIVCEDAHLEGAATLANALLDKLHNLKTPYPNSLSASFGVIEVILDEAMDDAFKRLDRLLYIGKENGRNQVVSKAG